MTEIKLTKRYPQSRTEDIVDAYMRGWNDALDAVQNGKFHINEAEQTEPSDSEKPNNCDDCKWWFGYCHLEECEYEPKTQTETQNSNLTFEKRTMLDCYNCKRFDTEDECIECHYEPKDEPQTDVYEYHNGEWVKPDCPWK